MNATLKYAAFAGVAVILLFIPSSALSVLLAFNVLAVDSTLQLLYAALNILYLIAYVVYAWGFKVIGEKTHNSLLVLASYAAIAFGVIFTIYSILPAFLPALVENFILAVLVLVSQGLVALFFAVAVFTLRKEFGWLALGAATTGALFGLCSLSVVLGLLGIPFALVSTILEVAILFKAAERF